MMRPHPAELYYARNTFDIGKIVTTKYDGSSDRWPEFYAAFSMAEKQMTEIGFTPTLKFCELLKVVSGAALRSIQHFEKVDASYLLAWHQLTVLVQDGDKPLMQAVQKLFDSARKKPANSDNSRRDVESEIIAYFTKMSQIPATAEEKLFAFELCIIRTKFDPLWAKEWNKFTRNNVNRDRALGYNGSGNDICFAIHEANVQATLIPKKEEGKAGGGGGERDKPKQGGKPPQGKGGRKLEQQSHHLASSPTTNATPVIITDDQGNVKGMTTVGSFPLAAGQPSRGGGAAKRPENKASGSSKPKHECVFCRTSGGGQEFPHQYARQCPLVKPTSNIKKKDGWIKNEAIRQKCCRNCLAKEHATAKCDAPPNLRCPECKERHHPLFCPQGKGDDGGSRGKPSHQVQKNNGQPPLTAPPSFQIQQLQQTGQPPAAMLPVTYVPPTGAPVNHYTGTVNAVRRVEAGSMPFMAAASTRLPPNFPTYPTKAEEARRKRNTSQTSESERRTVTSSSESSGPSRKRNLQSAIGYREAHSPYADMPYSPDSNY